MARIPDRANNEASSMWKMNDVYVARNGDEWPETYVPYNASQVWIARNQVGTNGGVMTCLLYTSPSPRDGLLSRMPSSA